MLQSGGIETTTGPLGQGISTAVGMALAERILNARFGDDLVDHYTYVIASDGDLMEGISHEASSFAGHLGLSKLIVLWDDNQISIDGPTSLSFTDDTLNRFRAYGWDVREIDGHNPQQIHTAIEYARTTDAPSLIACKTIIGYGAPPRAAPTTATARRWAPTRSRPPARSWPGRMSTSSSPRKSPASGAASASAAWRSGRTGKRA